MILISIRPFDSRKILALIATLICLSSISCFAQSLLLSVASTPYDRQMTRIQPVLFSRSVSHKQNLSVAVVNHWIENLRGIPYGFSTVWKTPAEVRSSPVADCKGKAVALYQEMRANGARNVRLVIGKRSWSSSMTHTWLEWSTSDGTYVLDPTINWAACRAEHAAYIPFYAYSGSKKYRATSTALYARN